MSSFFIKEVRVIDSDYQFLREELKELEQNQKLRNFAIAVLPDEVLADNASSFVPESLARSVPVLLWKRYVEGIEKRRIIYASYGMTSRISPESIIIGTPDEIASNEACLRDGVEHPEAALVLESMRAAVSGEFVDGNRPDMPKLVNAFKKLSCPALGAEINEFVRVSYHWHSCWGKITTFPIESSVRGLCGGNLFRDAIALLESQADRYRNFYLTSKFPLTWPEVFNDAETLGTKCRQNFGNNSLASLQIWKEGLLYLASFYYRLALESIRAARLEEAILKFVRCLECSLQGLLISDRVVEIDFNSGQIEINGKKVKGCGNYVAAVKKMSSAIGGLETRRNREVWAEKTNRLLAARNNLFLVHGLCRLDSDAVDEYLCSFKRRLEELLLARDWTRMQEVGNALRCKPGQQEMNKVLRALWSQEIYEFRGR